MLESVKGNQFQYTIYDKLTVCLGCSFRFPFVSKIHGTFIKDPENGDQPLFTFVLNNYLVIGPLSIFVRVTLFFENEEKLCSVKVLIVR